jgi:hypothetical protein
MPLSRLETIYLKLGFLLCILSLLILLFFWESLPQEVKCVHVKDFTTHLVETCDKMTFSWNILSGIIFAFFLEFICLVFIPPQILNFQFSFLVNKKNAANQYRISRSLFCSYFLGSSLICVIFEWENIQFALGKIEKINPFVLQSSFIWLAFIISTHLYLHFRFR